MISDRITDLKKLWFLDGVWLPFAAEQEFTEAAARYVKSAKLLYHNREYRRQFQQDLRRTKLEIEKNVQDFIAIRKVWNDFHLGVTNWEKEGRLHTAIERVGAWRHFGLIRFGLPDSTMVDVERSALELSSCDAKERNAEMSRLVSLYTRMPQGLEVVRYFCTLFWMLKMEPYLQELAKKVRTTIGVATRPVWLEVMYCASLIRSGNARTSIFSEVIASLRAKQELVGGAEGERAELLVGLAFLLFHLWKAMGGTAYWRLPPNQKVVREESSIEDAIRYARTASMVHQASEELHIYALNLYVYYVTEGGSDSEFDEARSAARMLIEVETSEKLWQYRFADTLARFFHREALMRSDEEREQMMTQARRYITQASANCGGDPDVVSYSAVLATYS
jgi:hypothetical protein